MNNDYAFLTLLILLAAGLSLRSQPAATLPGQELSMAEAIRVGLANSYQIQIADNNVEIARNENDPGFAGAYPDVNATFDVNNGYTNLNQPASFLQELSTASTGIVPGVNLNWILYDGGRVRLTRQQLEELQVRSEGDLKIAVENTIERIILAYYAVLLREEQLEVLEEVLELSRDRIEYEEVKREFGQASTFDILQTRDAYLNDSTTYITELTNYENAIHNLNRAMGLPELNREYLLTDTLTFDLPVYELGTLRANMLANNNQLNTLYVDRELAQINTRLRESERLPQVNLGAGATYNWSQNLFGTGTFADGNDRDLGGIRNQTINGFLNFGASYNIFNGGARRINIQNARIQELNAQLGIQQLELELNNQLANTYAAYLNERELVRVTTDRVENARRNLEIAEERFRGGLINSFDYRTIQLNYINASQARLQAIFNLKLTETELRRLVGDLVR